MTSTETERLIRVEERQKEMTVHISDLTTSLKANTKATQDIKSTLDGLTGGKQALIWITGTFIAVCAVVATYLGYHRN